MKIYSEKRKKHLEKLILLKRNRGFWHSPETIKKISEATKGKKRSEEFKKRLSVLATGRKQLPRSKEWCRRISISRRINAKRGENSPLWKGGSTLQEQIRKNAKYRQWRSDVYERDDYTCQFCGKKGGEINADHIKQFQLIVIENKIKNLDEALICEELWNINNGRTLCKQCHYKTETYSKKIK